MVLAVWCRDFSVPLRVKMRAGIGQATGCRKKATVSLKKESYNSHLTLNVMLLQTTKTEQLSRLYVLTNNLKLLLVCLSSAHCSVYSTVYLRYTMQA